MPGPSRSFYLIDGHAQIFRAFFAIRGTLNSPVTGEPTQAVFGMAGMFLKLYATCRPDFVAMAIDSPGKTFRDEIFGEYKANRAAPPPELDRQIPRVLEVTRLFGIPVLGQTGAEADDVIATVVNQVCRDGRYADVALRLVSKDKDLEQLLCDRVELYDIHTGKSIDTAWLLENRGIRPEQVIDLLTLTGDTVDNVPGVPGVGPKTAAELIQQFGSVEGIYANIGAVKGKRRENLLAARGNLPLGRRLVTLKGDLTLDFELERAKAGEIDFDGLRRVFNELGFVKHVAELERLHATLHPREANVVAVGSGATATPPADLVSSRETASGDEDGFADSLFATCEATDAIPGEAATTERRPGLSYASDFDYSGVTTREQFDSLVATLRRFRGGTAPIAIDTETISLGHRQALTGVSFAWERGQGVYVPMRSPQPEEHLSPDEVLAALRPIYEDPTIPKTGHNLKYDLLVLRHAGVRVAGVAFDTMIASHLAGMPGHGLDHLALSVLRHEMIPITRLIGLPPAPGSRGKGAKQKTMDQVPLDQAVPYASEDADISLRLYEYFAPQLRILGMGEWAAAVEMPLVEVLAEMEYNGFRIDPRELLAQQAVLARRIDELRDQIQAAAGEPFNPDSPRQLAELLFRKLGLPVVKRTKTGPSTDVEVLRRLAEREDLDPEKLRMPELIVDYRELTKLVGTYLEALREAIEPSTGRVHATFQQAVTATGRLSSNNPNLQNIPIRKETGRQIRRAFIAEPGHVLISADYSQIELRVLAHLSRDEILIHAFENDLDVHTAVAAQVFGVPLGSVTKEQRGYAKTINFGIVYGVSAPGLVKRIPGLGLDAARKLISDYRDRHKGIDQFLQQCIRQAMNLGYVTTMANRRRVIPEISSNNGKQRSLGERLAINSVVQGSAAEMIKTAMVNLQRRIERERLPMRMLLQIHDELVFESPEAEAERMAEIVKAEMEAAMTLRVPLRVEVGVGKNWFEAKS